MPPRDDSSEPHLPKAEHDLPKGARPREAHAHLPMHGRTLSMLDLSSCSTRAETLERVRERAAAMRSTSTHEWLLGFGLRVNGWTDDPRWITRHDLDLIGEGRPCCLMSFDYHSVAASTDAMAAAGIGLHDPDPSGGVICRDHEGVATGVLLESASQRAWQAAPQPDLDQWRRHLERGLADLASHGFREVHDLLSPSWLGPELLSLERQGRLPMDVWLYAPLESLEQHRSLPRQGRVRIAGAKLFADGTLNSRTAWTLTPYRDPLPGHPCGTPLLDQRRLREAMQRTREAGIGLAVHAIGDSAVRAVLDAAEATGTGGWIGDVPRLRIEHCELIAPEDVGRFAALDVVASVQPCHLLADAPVLSQQFPDEGDRVLPLRALVDSGCRPGELLWFGSDTPIVRPHPRDSIMAAMRRTGQPGLTLAECVAAFGA